MGRPKNTWDKILRENLESKELERQISYYHLVWQAQIRWQSDPCKHRTCPSKQWWWCDGERQVFLSQNSPQNLYPLLPFGSRLPSWTTFASVSTPTFKKFSTCSFIQNCISTSYITIPTASHHFTPFHSPSTSFYHTPLQFLNPYSATFLCSLQQGDYGFVPLSSPHHGLHYAWR